MPPPVSESAAITVPARVCWLAWIAAALAAAAVAFSFWSTIGKPDCMDMDFGSYYRAAQAVAAGRSPYFVDSYGPLGTYPYAPIFPFMINTLQELDYIWACRVWLLFNWLALAACCWLALRLVMDPGRRPEQRWQMLGLALLPTAAYAWATLRAGQVSIFMLLGCLMWAACRRTGWRFVGGLFLATACALKLAPGIFILYLLLRRDLRGLAGVAAGAALLMFGPALWVGMDGAIDLHAEWIHHTALTQVPEQTYRPGNQSLLAQLARLPPISNGFHCYSLDNLDMLYDIYPVVMLLAVVSGFAALAWRRWRQSADWQWETVELALLFTFLTLAQPRGWRCNFIAMLLPCLLLARQVCERGRHWQLAAAALVCMALACALPTHWVNEDGWHLGVWLLLGKHFWGAVAVGAVACLVRRPFAGASG